LLLIGLGYSQTRKVETDTLKARYAFKIRLSGTWYDRTTFFGFLNGSNQVGLAGIADNAVNSAKIADASIVNADILSPYISISAGDGLYGAPGSIDLGETMLLQVNVDDSTIVIVNDTLHVMVGGIDNLIANNGLQKIGDKVGQRIIKSIAVLEATTADSNGAVVYLVDPPGVYTQIDSIYPESYSGVAYNNATPGRQWILDDYLRRRIVNPVDFGAISGDGLNDAPAIQAAMDFLEAVSDSGGDCILSAGIYHVGDDTLFLPYRVNLMAEGGAFHQGPSSVTANRTNTVAIVGLASHSGPLLMMKYGGPVAQTDTLQNSTIKGIKFDGRSIASMDDFDDGLVVVRQIQGVKIEDCTFYASRSWGLVIWNSVSVVVIVNDFIANISGAILQRNDATNVLIADNIIGTNTGPGIKITNGLAAGSFYSRNMIYNNGGPGIDIESCVSSLFVDNRCDDGADYGIYIRGGVTKCIFSGNMTVRNEDVGLKIEGKSISPTQYNIITGHLTSNNVNTKQDTGLYIGKYVNYNQIEVFSDDNTSINYVIDTLAQWNKYNGFGDISRAWGNLYNDFTVSNEDTLILAQDTFVKIKGYEGGYSSINVNNYTTLNDTVVIFDSLNVYNPLPAKYSIIGNMSFVVFDSGKTIQGYIGVNGIPDSSYAFEVQSNWADQVLNATVTGVRTLKDSDYVELYVMNTSADDTIAIRSATLEIQQFETAGKSIPVLGAEDINNGRFPSATTNWQNSGTNPYETFAVSGGRLHLVNSSGSGVMGTENNAISLTAGKLYRIAFEVEVISGSNLTAQITVNSFGSIVATLGTFGTGYHEIEWPSNITGGRILKFFNTNSSEWYLDNVSVREVTYK